MLRIHIPGLLIRHRFGKHRRVGPSSTVHHLSETARWTDLVDTRSSPHTHRSSWTPSWWRRRHHGAMRASTGRSVVSKPSAVELLLRLGLRLLLGLLVHHAAHLRHHLELLLSLSFLEFHRHPLHHNLLVVLIETCELFTGHPCHLEHHAELLLLMRGHHLWCVRRRRSGLRLTAHHGAAIHATELIRETTAAAHRTAE